MKIQYIIYLCICMISTSITGMEVIKKILTDSPGITPPNAQLTITTPRLTLSLLKTDDASSMYYALSTTPTIYEWMHWPQPIPQNFLGPYVAYIASLIAQKRIEKGVYLALCLREKDTNNFCGSVALHSFDTKNKTADIAYWCCQAQQKKGYITEATNALIRYAFANHQHEIHTLYIKCDNENEASYKVAEKLNAKLEYSSYNMVEKPGCPLGSRLSRRYSISNAKNLPPLNIQY